MAQTSLVADRVRDARRLLAELHRATFPVAVAAWVKLKPEGVWHLYIGTPRADGRELLDAYGVVGECLRRVPSAVITVGDVKLYPPDHPTVRAIATDGAGLPPGRVYHAGPRLLAGLSVSRLILLPPAGHTTREEVVRSVAEAIGGEGPRDVVIERGGRLTPFRPLGIRLDPSSRRLEVEYEDPPGSGVLNRMPADEITDIRLP